MTRHPNKTIPSAPAGVSYRHYTIGKITGGFAILFNRQIVCTQPTEHAARAWIDRRVGQATRSNDEGDAA
jgi:hypothetical protein